MPEKIMPSYEDVPADIISIRKAERSRQDQERAHRIAMLESAAMRGVVTVPASHRYGVDTFIIPGSHKPSHENSSDAESMH